MGPITNFGSIYVNGARFDTSNTEFSVDDEPGMESDLEKGMKVKVKGRITADRSIAKAERVEYDADIEGPIESISLTEQFIVVLGTTIYVDDLTEFDDVEFTELSVDDVVEVSMIANDDGTYVATRIEKEYDDDDYEIKGIVENLDVDNLTFTLKNKTVDYSNAFEVDDISNGDYVEVEFRDMSPDGIIYALEVEVESDDDDGSQGYTTIKSQIAELTDGNMVLTSGEVIAINSDTEVENGELSDLTVGMRIVVEAEYEDGSLVADEIWIVSGEEVVIRSRITDIDVSDMEIEVLGRDYEINDYTVFVDESVIEIRQMTINDLVIGDEVEVVSIATDDDDDWLATKVTRFDSPADGADITEVKGDITAINETSFEVSGHTIEVNSATAIYLDDEDQYLTVEEFFALASVGDEVEVMVSVLEDGTKQALEIELEKDDDDYKPGSAKIEGTVTASLVDNTFELNGKIILIDENTQFDDGDVSDLVEGAYVEVRITETEDGSLLALEVEFTDNDDYYKSEVEGEITEVIDEWTFVVNDVTVIINEQTEFEDDASRADIALGVMVEVEGYFDSDGNLIAKEIELEMADDQELMGNITEVVSDIEFFIGDQRIILADDVEFDDGNALKLKVGVFVKLEGYYNEEGDFIATEVDFDDED
jgi:hypothetical protein